MPVLDAALICHLPHGTAPTSCCAATSQTCISTLHAESRPYCPSPSSRSAFSHAPHDDTPISGPHLTVLGVNQLTVFTSHHLYARCHLILSSPHTFPAAIPLPMPEICKGASGALERRSSTPHCHGRLFDGFSGHHRHLPARLVVDICRAKCRGRQTPSAVLPAGAGMPRAVD